MNYIVLYGGTILFSGMMLYDTQRVIAIAETAYEFGNSLDVVIECVEVVIQYLEMIIECLVDGFCMMLRE